MKHLLRSALPAPVIRSLQRLRDGVVLTLAPRLRFDWSHLVDQSSCDLSAVMHNPAPTAEWAAVDAAIGAAFGTDAIYAGANTGDRRFLYHLVRHIQPHRVLETGTHVGASTAAIAMGLKSNGRGQLTSVDIHDVNAADGPWRDLALPAAPRDLMNRLGCRDHVRFETHSSTDFMRATTDRFDLIFLDGNHDSDFVYAEIDAALRCLAPNGWLVLHDVYPQGRPLGPDPSVIFGPDAALRRIARENSADMQVVHLSPLPWPARGDAGQTSLALLVRQNK